LDAQETARQWAVWVGRPVARVGGKGSQARVVLRPSTVKEAVRCVEVAAQEGIPLVPQGGRTSLGANWRLRAGEVGLSTAGLGRVRRVDPEDGVAVVEAGVRVGTLRRALARQGLRVGVDVRGSGRARVGGVVAMGAHSPWPWRDGPLSRQLVGVEAVLGDGSVLPLGPLVPKNNTGYPLGHLVVGAGGALGLVTAVTLRLAPALRRWQGVLVRVASWEALGEAWQQARRCTGEFLLTLEVLTPRAASSMGLAPRASSQTAAYLLLEAGTSATAESSLGIEEWQRRGRSQWAEGEPVPLSRAELEKAWARLYQEAGSLGPVVSLRVGAAAYPSLAAWIREETGEEPLAWGPWGIWHVAIPAAAVARLGTAGWPVPRTGGPGDGDDRGLPAFREQSPQEVHLWRQLRSLLDPAGVLQPRMARWLWGA
jgi:FAD/FMN-containing dehydrogenase